MLGFHSGIMGTIDEFRPHVAILDYRLNGQEAVGLCKQIKERYPFLPVLALSCNSDIHEAYQQNGFDGYIKKPFDLDLLYTVLCRHIPKSLNSDS
jgi:DNA-binding NtrC family response regulator